MRSYREYENAGERPKQPRQRNSASSVPFLSIRWSWTRTQRACDLLRSVGMGEMIEFPSNGSTAGGYLAAPEGGSGPGVIVIQEWWGLVDHIEDVCDRFAAAGFVALAPDLYHGQKVQPGEPDEAGKAMMAHEDGPGRPRHERRRRRGVAAELGRQGRRHRLLHGGRARRSCWRRSVRTRWRPWSRVTASSRGPTRNPTTRRCRAAVLGHYAENDSFFTPDAANALADELRGLGKSVEIVIYPGHRPRVLQRHAARGLRRGRHRARCGTGRWSSSRHICREPGAAARSALSRPGPARATATRHDRPAARAPTPGRPRPAGQGQIRLLPSGHVRTLT